MVSTSKSAIIGGTTTLVEYVVVDVANKGESVVAAFNEAKANLEAEASSVAVSVVLALQVNGWNQDAKAGMEELVKEQVSCLLCRLLIVADMSSSMGIARLYPYQNH